MRYLEWERGGEEEEGEEEEWERGGEEKVVVMVVVVVLYMVLVWQQEVEGRWKEVCMEESSLAFHPSKVNYPNPQNQPALYSTLIHRPSLPPDRPSTHSTPTLHLFPLSVTFHTSPRPLLLPHSLSHNFFNT
ncbi:hypothetical protein Pcinc_032185 [Petrolisthes cinctipes]|uniref:Uncharacterized protein n=1 Tax=Petrolisthes cinctipes TaxID=88211 RepID=A0AAE1K3E5_PETCI|nr:hypothetical protein Pcinc_032185 [Petrolisthes cinctipes]